jgi:hypothetical protein
MAGGFPPAAMAALPFLPATAASFSLPATGVLPSLPAAASWFFAPVIQARAARCIQAAGRAA